jgi:hypothetical protein
MNGLQKIYLKRGYFASRGTDVLISTVLVVGCLVFVTRASYTELLASVRADWANQRCNPLYMPFAGAIMPVPGQSAMKTASKNFDYCAQTDVSAVLKTALMPLEYVAFVLIRTVDLLVHAIVGSMALLARLKAQLGSLFNMTFLKIADVLVPITVFLVRMRDSMAKMNAIMVTTLFTSMVVYKITVSGMLNIMIIMMNLMLVLIGVLVGMFLLALILLINPFTTIAGIILTAATFVIIVGLLIPAIVLYSMLHTFLMNTFGIGTASPPRAPSN